MAERPRRLAELVIAHERLVGREEDEAPRRALLERVEYRVQVDVATLAHEDDLVAVDSRQEVREPALEARRRDEIQRRGSIESARAVGGCHPEDASPCRFGLARFVPCRS